MKISLPNSLAISVFALCFLLGGAVQFFGILTLTQSNYVAIFYLNWGKPVLASVSYEVNSPYICVYDGLTTQALGIACERLLSFSGDTSVSNEIARSVNNDMRWTCKIGKIIDVIGNLEKLRGL